MEERAFFETPPQFDAELDEKTLSLAPDLGSYLTGFYSRLWSVEELSFRPEAIQVAGSRALEIIDRNNLIARLISSEDYEEVVAREKILRGPCALGASICIDGRLPILHMFGRVVNCWEKTAGEIQIEPSPVDSSPQLSSGRLTEAIIDRVSKGQLLEILIAHTSLKDPAHGCGAMIARQLQGEFLPGDDLVLENLKIHKQSAEAITGLYNRAAEAYGGEKLERVAIAAVFDTDTMGFMFGYGEENPLFTTDLSYHLIEKDGELVSSLVKRFGQAYGQPGGLRLLFTEADLYVGIERMLANISSFLLDYEKFRDPVDNYLALRLSDLTSEQQQALRFVIARNVAFQYLTGLYKEKDKEHPDHPFAAHGEGYQAISLEGVSPGQFDPEEQVFGASPDTVEESIDHILTQCTLMDKGKVAEEPYILFVSTATSIGRAEGILAGERVEAALERDRGRNRELWNKILHNQDIMDRVKKGGLLVVPVLIDDRTRQIVEVLNHAI